MYPCPVVPLLMLRARSDRCLSLRSLCSGDLYSMPLTGQLPQGLLPWQPELPPSRFLVPCLCVSQVCLSKDLSKSFCFHLCMLLARSLEVRTKCHGGLMSSYCKIVLHNQKYGLLSKTALLYVTFGKFLISLDFNF